MRHSETDSSVNSTSISKHWLRHNYSCRGNLVQRILFQTYTKEISRSWILINLTLGSESEVIFKTQKCFDYKARKDDVCVAGVGWQDGLSYPEGAWRKRQETCTEAVPGALEQRAGQQQGLWLLFHSSESWWEVAAAQMPCSLSVVCDFFTLLGEISALRNSLSLPCCFSVCTWES